MMRFAVPLLLLLLAACATQSPKAEFQNNAHACSLVPAVDCAAMLEQKKIVGRSQSEVLMSVALTALTQNDPDFAIPYLDVIIEHDPTYALAFQNRGSAAAMLALRAKQEGNQLMTVGNYFAAVWHYEKAMMLEPENQINYLGAVAALSQLPDCKEPQMILLAYESRFGRTPDYLNVASVIEKKCR